MRSFLTTVAIGLGAGLVASLAMDQFQAAAAPALGQGGGNDDPATVKAADSVSQLVEGRAVTQKHRRLAGGAMHYGVGAALGIGYVAAAERWPETATGFGLPFGAMTMLLLDDLLVPAAGWGPWPEAEAKGNLYALASHLVFAATVEGVRRGADALLARD
ncbi:DUF1440 domain-containing protein [Sphingomonas sp. BK580]|uniref:DUF1440 domain-containing protein n=1 Tax=Sphingomonas sp. BK580 TaxID=2586972 RepID=UPI00161395E5|nr:DUF1440 domain-containing protein [Sphingomonas sp. BK580]MBB3694238.1 hypothetical protein [Sphingomonas sp. BK580]